jgi:hypothetical protein
MEASAGLVAGSHNRNELVVIRRDGEPGVRASGLANSLGHPLPSGAAVLIFLLLVVCFACSRSR